MRGRLRALWLSVNASYWFLPTLFTIAAFLLSLVTIYADRNGGSQWLSFLPWFEPSQPDGAREQLTVVAGAMIAIASTVFAITIAAVAYASGNYGPRLLTNFMTDRGNQVSLGVFIATFVYNLMILRVVRDPEQGVANEAAAAAFVPQVSVLVSGITVLFAVGILVYFLHHVPASIRINTVLGGIGRRLIDDIEERFPQEGVTLDPAPVGAGHPVTATATGYIEIIDFAGLDSIAEENGLTISLAVRTGDFIHPHLPLASVTGTPPTDTIEAAIRGAFSFGTSRTPAQDLEYLIDELVEIALRALSPGINDPFTAVTTLHWMGAAMARLAERDLCRGPEQERYDTARVRPIADGFRHFLARGFGGIRPSAAGSPIAAKMFLSALLGVAASASSAARRAAIQGEARLLVRQAKTALAGPALEEVLEALEDFEAAVGRLAADAGSDSAGSAR